MTDNCDIPTTTRASSCATTASALWPWAGRSVWRLQYGPAGGCWPLNPDHPISRGRPSAPSRARYSPERVHRLGERVNLARHLGRQRGVSGGGRVRLGRGRLQHQGVDRQRGVGEASPRGAGPRHRERRGRHHGRHVLLLLQSHGRVAGGACRAASHTSAVQPRTGWTDHKLRLLRALSSMMICVLGRVDGRSHYAPMGSVLANPSIQKVRAK